MDLIALARQNGLDPGLITDEKWPQPAPLDAALSAPLGKGPLEAMDGAPRRGLDPRLTSSLWSLFERRPVELGLFAWDLLSNSLVHPDELEKVRGAARVVREVLPAPVERFTRTHKVSAGELVGKMALPAFTSLADADMDQAIQFHALGSLEVNQVLHRKAGKTINEVALKMAHQFARYLSVGHMTTLASFYLDYLWHRCQYRPALDDLVETYIDAGCINYPWKDELIASGDAEQIELLEYAAGRSWIELDLNETYNDQVRERGQLDYRQPAEAAQTHARLHLVRAHSFLAEEEQPVPFEVIAAIVKASPGWRYAGRVRLAMLAQITPAQSDLPLRVFDGFQAAFGNETGTWNDLNVYAPSEAVWRPGLYARTVREAITLPHDPSAWRCLGISLRTDDEKAWHQVIRARIEAQCKLGG